MSELKLLVWVVLGYAALCFSPLFIALTCDTVLIPFILWMHRVGILKAKP